MMNRIDKTLQSPTSSARVKNIVISGTNYWNPGDDFVRDGIIQILRTVFGDAQLNFLFYNFNADYFPRDKFAGLGNDLAKGDLENCRDSVDAVIIAGLSAGEEIKDLYRWVVANGLEEKVYLIGAGYENGYVEHHVGQEPEATIFRKARLITSRTAKTPEFIRAAGISYHHINCPAILSVPEVKTIPPGQSIQRIAFSIQLPHEQGVVNQTCARNLYELSVEVLRDLSRDYEVSVIAHHKSEYFHFLKLLRGLNIPVIFSSFYQDLHQIYPQFDLVITTRLHSSLFANGHGLPGIIINDTDRHTHTLQGFKHSLWVQNRTDFDAAFAAWKSADLSQIASELTQFKAELLATYVSVLSECFEKDSSPEAKSYIFDSEKKEQLLVRSMLRPGMVVFDVGANIGKYTKLFSLLAGSQGKVFAFEPDPDSVKKLRDLVERDSLNNVKVINVAVSDASGRATFNRFPDEYCSWNGLGRPQMEDPKNPTQYVPFVGSVEVETQTLDAFCDLHDISRIDYLKLDVEGAELKALNGARGLLRRQAIGLLQFEVSLKMLEGLDTCARPVFDLLAEFGYECHAILPTGEIGEVVTDSSAFYDNYIALPGKATPKPEIISNPANDLPIHFFTIVLNGQPFIQHHIEQLSKLPFRWHWHIVEGVAELNHDTAWSKATGGTVPAELHRNGLSIDGTTEYLDTLKAQFPENITVYRTHAGAFWDGKREMVNAPLAQIKEQALLWQIDADELWTATQFIRARALFRAQPEKTAALFYCDYFVGPELIITSRDTYGNNSSYEWLRVWRYQPGDQWAAHEPPILRRGDADIASINPFRQVETERMGLVFQHFAYSLEAQVQFKESYYGYAGAVEQWRKLQLTKEFPQRLADHFDWVKDSAVVNRISSRGIKRLAPPAWFGPIETNSSSLLDGAERILFVRTDSIGDAVLASAMLEPIRSRHPQARIAVLCQHHVADLFAACPLVDSIICYDRKKMDDPAERGQILIEIAEFKPDVVLNSVRSRDHFSNELTQAYRNARHIAIEGDFANISISDHARTLPGYEQIISSPEDLKPELGRHADFLHGLGIQTASLQPVIWTCQEDEILADTFFASHELDPAKTIAVFPGAQHEIRVYHGYAKALKTLNDFRFLVFGDAAQEGLGAELERQLPGRIINLCGRSTLREAAALMRRCRLYVGAESAGAHIACAVGVPNVVLLGGGHFGRFMPYSPLTSAVSLPLECFGCNWRCQYRHAHCVKDISAEVLATAIRETLAKPAARPQLFLDSKDSWTTENSRPNWRLPEAFISLGSVEVHVVQSRTGQIVKAMDPVTGRDLTCGSSRTVEPAKVEIVGEGIANPEVSVVVSAYRSEKYIRACLENLSRQTIFDRCEILVVDSGSPENERAIVADFQLRFPNIRYIRTSRETIYGAWNRGLEFAKGRYWANANTDDSMRDDALEILVAALDAHQDCALAYADAAWTTTPNDRFPSATITKTVKYSDYTPIESLFFCITGCLQFFRTDSLRQLGGFDSSLHCAGDYEATLKLMAARMNAVHVPEVLSLFFQNTAGLSQADDRASKEHELLMSRYRDELDIGNLFEASDKNRESTAAFGWVSLALRAEKFTVPWETTSFEQAGFALQCFHRALDLAPKDDRIGLNVVAFYQRLQRLDIQGDELIERWPKMRQWIDRIKKGEVPPRVDLAYTVVGPVFRVDEWKSRPTAEQLALFPEALRPWICRISGRHVYFSRDLFPLPSGERYQPQQLEKAGLRLAKLLAHLPPFYAHFGGAGDLLLLLASFYDQTPKSVLFSHPNSIGATQALLEGFPELSQIYFLPQHTEPFFHIILRYAVYELKNCLGAGTTPKDAYDVEWKAGLNIEKKYGIKKSPQWAARFRQNKGSRKVAVAPKGSLSGMVGTKRNIIDPEIWTAVIEHIQARGFEPVIFGVASEAIEYPALPGCVDARTETFFGQMQSIGRCAGLVGADSWAKSFTALAQIPTVVFEPLKGADLAGWKDASDWVFIEPWQSIKMVNSLDSFRRAFDVRIAHIPDPTSVRISKPNITWEGSFLDYGSLSHINRELTDRLPTTFCVSRVGSRTMPAGARSDSNLARCAKQLVEKAPANSTVTVRHQWPPNWSKPASGLLVVIQPWEYGALPKEWISASATVDEFWVPSPLVRDMYLDSGIAPQKVRVVPNGVDTNKYRPGIKPMPLETKKKFKFLFVGGTIFRKGPDILLEAFVRAFTAKDDVCLVIKDFGGDSCYQGQTAEEVIRKLKLKPGTPEILHLTKNFSAEEMPSLYAACDCLVLPYRGEGFGMPVLEAMSCGLPVIVTDGGATDSFVTREAGWRIPSDRKLLGDHVGNIQLAKNGWLREPLKEELAAIFKTAANNPAECRRRGAIGREIAVKRFDWNDIAASVAHRLKELAEMTPVPPTSIPPAKEITAQEKSTKIPEVVQVGQLKEARQLVAQKQFEAAWSAVTAVLALRPFHPEAFLLLAKIALKAGDASSARKCAQFANGHAPSFSDAKQFLEQPLQGGITPNWLKLPVQIQKDQATKLSVCLIVKDEEKFLRQCLQSVRNLASQIVVVDTGSTDRTVETAREFGAEVYSFIWSDDFAAARNEALKHATGDWVLMVDADEELPVAQHAKLLEDIKNSAVIGYRLPLVDIGKETEGRSHVPRLYRNAPGLYYTGRIHEQIFGSLLLVSEGWGIGLALGTAEILHHGYTRESVRDRNKVERNLNLLKLAISENDSDVNLIMNLGLELVRSGDLTGGLVQYREAFEMMSAQSTAQVVPELREVLLTQLTSQLFKIGAQDEVVRTLTSPLAKRGGLTSSLHLALGLAAFELKDYQMSAHQMRQCLDTRNAPALSPINVEIHGAAPWHCLALSLARLKDATGAEKAFRAAASTPGAQEIVKLDYARFLAQENRPVEALEKLNELVAINSKLASAWSTGGEIALSRTEFAEFACDWTGEAIRALPEDTTILTQRAEALTLYCKAAEAVKVWQRLGNLQPGPRQQAALTLCELVANSAVHGLKSNIDELSVSRSFIEWYQKLIRVQAKSMVGGVNGRLKKLAHVLPTAGRILEEALAESSKSFSA